MGLLQDRKAIITGASRGIGRAIALAFAQEGAHVALLATNQELLDGLAAEIAPLGRTTVARAVDLCDGDAVKAAVDEAKQAMGGVDIVVNNAGITCDQLLMRHKEEDFQRVLDVNLTGAFRVTKAASRYLLKSPHGRVINLSSVVGITGNAGQCSYAASKAGLIGFSKSLAQELASRGVTVNIIAPGFIETDMTAKLSEEQQAAVQGHIPLGKIGTANDIAHTAVFLASDRAAYITGAVLQVDGGLSM